MHKKTMSIQLNLLLFVFCLHVLFMIHFSINFLNQLSRRCLCYNIKVCFVTVTLYVNSFYSHIVQLAGAVEYADYISTKE